MKDLDELRLEIDKIDKELVNLILSRMDVSKEIGEYKKSVGKPVLDTKREEEKLEAVSKDAPLEKKEAIKEIYKTIMAESRKIQK